MTTSRHLNKARRKTSAIDARDEGLVGQGSGTGASSRCGSGWVIASNNAAETSSRAGTRTWDTSAFGRAVRKRGKAADNEK